ncbi:MAG: 30S ribosomal protein S12 methylthiotransferase RimO [Candidatus Cloacimonetes bacterium]|nr:30S ribosomal protein S12 methylthiotransferase RimO [Candidatus Cloacimonadota bacterium]
MKKYAMISLGCSKNLVDSEIFAAIIEQKNFIQTDLWEEAEVIIINTCGFILDAKEESIETILTAVEFKKTGNCKRLIVTGCLIKRYFNEIKESIPEIDELVEFKDFQSFAKIFKTNPVTERKLLTLPHFAFLRVSDGCNNHCSYCAIPAIRGDLQSVPIKNLIKEAQSLAERGVKELIITAQDTAQYGVDIYGKPKLAELLTELHKIDKFEWIRLLYLHPVHITSEIINTIAKLSKVCKYFEVPIQHINDEILQSMNRKVTKKKIISIINEIRNKIPRAIIRTTLIVGYPGETEEKFQELKDFIHETKFERLGIFTYSREEDTPAYSLKEQVPKEVAETRKDELMLIQQSISEEFLAGLIGKKIKVIIDRISDDKEFPFEGRGYFDAPEIDGTVFIEEGKAEVGDIVEVEITDSWEYDLVGKIVN